jgi:hypothetical protein
MNLKEHLLYQQLLSAEVSTKQVVQAFENLLLENQDHDIYALRKKAQEQVDKVAFAPEWRPPDMKEKVYFAKLFQEVYQSFSEHTILDLFNLVHKEELANRIWLLLHNDEIEFTEVEQYLRDFCLLPVGESQISPNIALGIRVYLISYLISDNLFFIGVAKHYINMRDIGHLLGKIIGRYGSNSRIGGKSAGMIVANRILRPTLGTPPDFHDRIAEVESWYLTSQVFNTFMKHNRLEDAHGMKYLDHDEIVSRQEALYQRFLTGEFPQEIELKLRDILEQVSESPLIVRSSSLLEDSMGFSFYGKYDSFFITNQGTPEERYAELAEAIKKVYFGIFSATVIEYRKDKKLLDYKDMMCILIQRVVGARHGKYFFPAFAGVAFSRNLYRWNRRIRREDGVVRLVMGLGTRAVERSADDYPRLVALSHPTLRPEGTLEEVLKYSQRYVDVLDLSTRDIQTEHFVDLVNDFADADENHFDTGEVISVVQDGQLSAPLLFPDRLDYGAAAITFDGLLRREEFTGLVHGVLRTLEEAYGTPVDIEFAYQDGKLYVLQCRPLRDTGKDLSEVIVPDLEEDDQVVFTAETEIFRNALVTNIRYVVYVDAAGYADLPEPTHRLQMARMVGQVNRSLRGERFILVGPGRWGSNDPNLGVKVAYGDINNARMLVEVAEESGGYVPEVSYGTHFFQDLIETDIIPLPLYPDAPEVVFDRSFFRESENIVESILPKPMLLEFPECAEVLRVIDVAKCCSGKLLSVYLDGDTPRAAGIIRAPDESEDAE